jgi:hypothetical protein
MMVVHAYYGPMLLVCKHQGGIVREISMWFGVDI